jgi:hypothetical protein
VAGLVGESEWYEHQIGRLGDGLEPNPRLHAVTGAVRFLAGEMGRGLLERRRRNRLAGTGPTIGVTT